MRLEVVSTLVQAQTKVNAAGLVLAAVFLLVVLTLAWRASRANRGRTRRAALYVNEERATGATLPAHTWQAVAAPDLSSIFGLPAPGAVAQLPAFVRIVVEQAENATSVENARSTTVANTSLLVFDLLVRHSDNTRHWVERTVCSRFGLALNCPRLDVNPLVGLGTLVVGGNRVESFKFELDDFNRAYSVVGGDQRFAFSLFDGEMMRWFLANPALHAFQVQGGDAFVAFKSVNDANDADAVLAFVLGFLARIPPIVGEEWPRP